MLEVNLNEEKGVCHVQAGGTTLELAAYCSYVLHAIYSGLRPEVREGFRKAVKAMVNDPDFEVWTEDNTGLRGMTVSIPGLGK